MLGKEEWLVVLVYIVLLLVLFGICLYDLNKNKKKQFGTVSINRNNIIHN